MGATQRTRNRRKLGNIKRLCSNIRQYLTDVGQQYENVQPEIAVACFKGIELTDTLEQFVDKIIENI